MNKTFKKVLSVVLSIAMIAASITVTNTTAKAEGEPEVVTITATANATTYQIDANWAAPTAEFAKQGCYIYPVNADGIYTEDEAHYAKASNGWVWSAQGQVRTGLDTVVGTASSSDVDFKAGGDFVVVVTYFDASGAIVAKGVSNAVTFEAFVVDNTELNFKQTAVADTSKNDSFQRFSWDLVTGATAYKFEAVNADGSIARTWNYDGYTKENGYWCADVTGTAAGETYTARLTALGENNTVIATAEIPNVGKYFPAPVETTTADPDAETTTAAPEEAPTFDDVDVSAWENIPVKGDQAGTITHTYYFNKAGYNAYVNAAIWGVFAPASATDYHGQPCNLTGNSISFANKGSNAMQAVWVNGVKYAAGSDKFHARNDSCEIALELFNEGINYVAVVSDNSMQKFAIKVTAPLLPDATASAEQADIDPATITDWVQVAGQTESGATGYISEAAGNKMGNGQLRGFYAAGQSTNWNISEKMKTVPVFGFVANNANASSIIINKLEYTNAKDANNEKVYIGADCVYINQSLLEAPEGETVYYTITATGSAVDTFVLKVVGAPKTSDETPDQTYDPVTDWVQVPNMSANNTKFFVSEAFRNDKINHVDLFGLYTDHTTSPYHQAGCTLEGAAYVAAFPSVAGKMRAVWVDGVKYENKTADLYIEGDQVHMSQAIFDLGDAESKEFAVTVVTDDGNLTYGLKVEKAATYTINIDSEDVATVAEGTTYTLPETAKYGYFDGTNMYKAGAEVTVNSNMTFTAVNDLAVTMENGAGIRYEGTAGIRFQATVISGNDAAVKSDAITEGTLITAQDIIDYNGTELTLTSDYAKVDVKNSGWYNEAAKTYCGSLCDIVESNYIRKFTARAYVTINYVDGTTETIYSNMGPVRTISGIAKTVKDKGYPGIAEGSHSVIDSFIVE